MKEPSPKRCRKEYYRDYRLVKERQSILEEELPNNVAVHDSSSSNGDEDETIQADHEEVFSSSSEENSSDGDYGFVHPNEEHNSSADSDDETNVSHRQQMKTRRFLREWATKNNPPVETVNSLLRHLNSYMPGIPKCSTTLKETIGKIDVIDKCGGQYYNFGIKHAIDYHLKLYPNSDSLELIINVDGVQAYQSKHSSLWPVLVMINDKGPYISSIWYGKSKPSSVQLYLEDLVNELPDLLDNGHRGVCIQLSGFVCDAPARAFLKCIVSHTGYYGCERCVTRGIYSNGSVRLIDVDAALRTDEGFAAEMYDHHQRELSPLCQLEFPMISGFVIDSMHLVFLGVVKKLINNITSTLSLCSF